ncbi:hypothetical protein Tco_0608780 [Tanacetum coccineum]
MLAIFHDMIEESDEVFIDDFSVFGNSFDTCLNNLDKMLQRCKESHLVLNCEKCHLMVKEGIVLGHKVYSAGLEVDKAKIDVISKLPPPTNIKGVRSFLGHAGFYRRFITNFSKIARPLTKLLEKDTPFEFDDECQKAFELLKEKLTCAPVIVSPNWNLSFELMCDASDFVVGAILVPVLASTSFGAKVAEIPKLNEEVLYQALIIIRYLSLTNVGSVDKLVRDPNSISYDETPDSPSQSQTSSFNQRHYFHCKDPLEEHEHCKLCTCMRCGSGLSKGFCFICASIYNNSSQRLPNCPKCGDPVEGLYCRQCALIQKKLEEVFQDFQDTPESSNHNTNVNHPAFYNNDDDDDEEYTIAITPVLSTKEPDNSLSIGDEHLDTILATESDEVIKSSVENLVQIPSESKGILDKMCDVPFRDNSPPLDISKDQFEGFSYSNNDSTSIDDDSFSIDDIDYVEASPLDSELVSLEEVVEIVIPKVEGIDTDILLTIKDDILSEKLLNVNLLIAKIEALKDNPTQSFDFLTKSSSTSPNFFLEETNTFDNSLPESETFCFNLEEKSSGSTTILSDYSLPDYEAFYLDDDYIEEKSSGSTTTHADFFQYDSFIFDLSINPFPLADRSDFYHEEFADELGHIISPPKYDCFYFRSEPDLGDLTSIDPGIRENVSSTTNVNLPFKDNQSPLFAYVVWIFLSFLTYPVAPPYLLSYGNEDTIFDLDISIYRSFMLGVSHRSGTFMKFNVYPNHLNENLMEILSSTCSPMDQ